MATVSKCYSFMQMLSSPSHLWGDKLIAPLRLFSKGAEITLNTSTKANYAAVKYFKSFMKACSLSICTGGCLLSVPLAAVGVAVKAVAYKFGGSIENNFFIDPQGVFQTVILPQCKTNDQTERAIHLALYLWSLKRSSCDEKAILAVLREHDYSVVREEGIVEAAIHVLERILKKPFDSYPKEIAEELAVRFNTYFHGTNEDALVKIKEPGIGLTIGKKENASGIDEIDEITKTTNLFGHYSGQSGGIYVAAGPETAWEFGKRSPEWFASFWEIMDPKSKNYSGLSKKYAGSAFYGANRSKIKAMKQLKIWLAYQSFPKEKAIRIKQFAKKYWKRFDRTFGVVILLDRPVARSEAIQELYQNSLLSTPDQYRDALLRLFFDKSIIDYGGVVINQDVPAEKITFFRIPFIR